MQYAITPPSSFSNGRDEFPPRPLEALGGHPRRQVVDLRHATGVRRRARDDHLATHADQLIRERGWHHTPGRAGGIAIGAQQRLDDIGGVLE